MAMSDSKSKHHEGLGNNIPPTLLYVEIYFSANGSSNKEANEFFKYYGDLNWKNSKGKLFRNWKEIAWEWIYYKK